jgi:8-oxo-dGTP pyrophosphatase MutT (NUDIX family)
MTLLSGADALPAVPKQRLQASFLRARLSDPTPWSPEPFSERVLEPDQPIHPAAVLIGLIRHSDGLTVLLTRRASRLRKHPGQIAFPGGRCDADDASFEHTALREAFEEVGLVSRHAEVLGQMPQYQTGTGYRITPVLALITPGLAWTLAPDEVDQVFEVPLEFLMNPRNHQRRRMLAADGHRDFFAMPWTEPQAGEEFFIWGATAAMLRNLYRMLAA